MSSDSSRKKKVRRRQEATGDSYMRARRQIDRGGDDAQGADGLPASASEARLLSLLGLGRAGASDVTAVWTQHQLPVGTGERVDFDQLLRAPVGLQAGGSPVWLDLKDEFSGGSGPHGLMVGTTGSGKSVALQAMLFALCAQYSPDLLQLMFISAWDEQTFADFADYPHAVTVPRETDFKAALTALMDHRAAALRAADAVELGEDQIVVEEGEPLAGAIAGFDDLSEEVKDHVVDLMLERVRLEIPKGTFERYHRARAVEAGAELPPIPHMVVVIDEFSEQVRDDPGLASVVEVLMRKGRSLGIHVLAVSQTLDPIGAGRIAENAQYRIVLRVETAAASRRLIGGDDASELPRDPGVGFFSPGPGADAVAFRGFKVSRDLVRGVGRHLVSSGFGR